MAEERSESAAGLSFKMGEALLRNGAEIFRVQETMERVARAYDIEEYDVYVLSNAIFANAVENGEKINAKKLCMSAFHTPAFIASVLGILAGLSKVVICLINSPFGGAYLAVEGILPTSVTAIILMVVGYSMELTKELIRPCLKTILMRVLLQTLMAIGVLWAVHLWIGDNMLLNLAIISYMSAPATFSMQTFLKKEEGSAYVSTTNSMYCMVSILVYIILAAVVY
mgnify:CR=1 FL=1